MAIGESAQKVLGIFKYNDIMYIIHLKKSVVNDKRPKEISINERFCVI